MMVMGRDAVEPRLSIRQLVLLTIYDHFPNGISGFQEFMGSFSLYSL